MLLQSGEALRILNDFRNKMREIDIIISEAEIKNWYSLYLKSEMPIDELRKKVYEKTKKYREMYFNTQKVEKNENNKDLLDINFKTTGITLNHQDIDILSIVSCNSLDELLNLSKSIINLDIDESYLKSYKDLEEAKKYVYECYVNSLSHKYECLVNPSIKTKAKINLLLKKNILNEEEVKELTQIITDCSNVDDIVNKVYELYDKEKAEKIFEIFNARVISKSGVKESSWNVYTSMYNKISEFDTFTLDDIIKYNAVTLLNNTFKFDGFERALKLANSFDKKVRLNSIFFYMDFPDRYKNKSKEEIKELLRKYIISLCSFIKENGYESTVESIDALNEIINRFASKVGNPYDLRGTYKDNSDNLAGGWLNYVSLEDVLDILSEAKSILPNTNFVYNEVNLFDDKKYDVFMSVIDRIKKYEKEHNVKIIDSIGEQLHIDTSIDVSKIDRLLNKLKENNMHINITEFDMYVNPVEKYVVPIQLEEIRQAKMNELYDVLNKYRDIIDSFTIWSKTDDMDHNLGRVNENKIRFKEKLISNIHGGYFDMEFNTKRDSLVSNINLINGPAIQRFNYHTHTNRCGNDSTAKDQDYIIQALKKGMTSFGFTEHAPSPRIEYDEINERLSNDATPEYINSIKKLNKEFPDIKVYVGFEAGYSEALRLHLVNLRKQVDYMMLGQHDVIVDGEVVDPIDNPEYPLIYAKSIVDALDSGIFDIVAHPDYFMIYRDTCRDSRTHMEFMTNAEKAADIIGRKCEELDIPLEINLDSITRVENDKFYDGEHSFTHPRFYNELLKYDVRFLYGCDAHRPKSIKDINENIIRTDTILKTSEMQFVPDDYNPIKYRNPELDQRLLLSEYNSYSYETYMLMRLLEKITKEYTAVDLDLKMLDKVEGLIEEAKRTSKIESHKKFEELLNVAEDHFISDQEREKRINNNLKYMESFGTVTNNRISLLYKLKHFIVNASALGCYSREDYLIVCKELMEKEFNDNEETIKRSDDNIKKYIHKFNLKN